MNQVFFVGRLVDDASKGETKSGTSILKFKVAADAGYGDNKVTNFYNCFIFGKRAETKLSDYMEKGTQVAVTGELKHSKREYEGKTYWNLDVNVNEVTLAGGSKPKKKETAEGFDDDIPF